MRTRAGQSPRRRPASTERPSRPGRFRSRTMRSGGCSIAALSASAPSKWAVTVWPWRFERLGDVPGELAFVFDDKDSHAGSRRNGIAHARKRACGSRRPGRVNSGLYPALPNPLMWTFRMNVLFIGGTGIISTACTELAVARGFKVSAPQPRQAQADRRRGTRSRPISPTGGRRPRPRGEDLGRRRRLHLVHSGRHRVAPRLLRGTDARNTSSSARRAPTRSPSATT